MRSPVPLLVGLSALGLVALLVFPPAALALAATLILGGAVVGRRGDRVGGYGLAGTGIALFLATVLVLALARAREEEPVIIGPDTGLTPSRP